MKKININLSELMGIHKVRSINQLSKETGISQQVLSKLYEEDQEYNPQLNTLARICDYFKCSLGELVEYKPDKEEGK